MHTINRALFTLAATAVMATTTQAAIIVYSTTMLGTNEFPPNASPGVGTALVTVDTILNTMRVQANFSGLTGSTTAAHIHANPTGTPGTGNYGVATQTPSFSGFPLGVTSGSMDTTFDMTLASSYNASFVTANGGTTASAFAALLFCLDTNRSYFNIHSSTFAGGEIRGFLAPVPEPGTMAALCLGAIALLRRRRQ